MADATDTACELCGNAPGAYCADGLCRERGECGAVQGAACDPFCTAPVVPASR